MRVEVRVLNRMRESTSLALEMTSLDMVCIAIALAMRDMLLSSRREWLGYITLSMSRPSMVV